jgi:hypothetical protein
MVVANGCSLDIHWIFGCSSHHGCSNGHVRRASQWARQSSSLRSCSTFSTVWPPALIKSKDSVSLHQSPGRGRLFSCQAGKWKFLDPFSTCSHHFPIQNVRFSKPFVAVSLISFPCTSYCMVHQPQTWYEPQFWTFWLIWLSWFLWSWTLKSIHTGVVT